MGGVSANAKALGDSCAQDARRNQGRCVSLRYVVYRDGDGQSAESGEDTLRALDQVNRLWDECGIRFQIDEFAEVKPQAYSLRYRAADYRELNEIRRGFSSPSSFLVVVTGPWNRAGSLGNTWANAWTNLPGEGLYGAILEKPVALDPNMLAHELGHYMSLGHVADRDDLMNPIIYSSSVRLDREQCRDARWALQFYWSKALR